MNAKIDIKKLTKSLKKAEQPLESPKIIPKPVVVENLDDLDESRTDINSTERDRIKEMVKEIEMQQRI